LITLYGTGLNFSLSFKKERRFHHIWHREGETMSRLRSCSAVLILTMGLAPVRGQEVKDKPIPAAPALAGGINGIGPIGGKVDKLRSGFQFAEGPAADARGNVYFSDIPSQRIYKVTPLGKFYLFRDNSNHANGLAVNARGEIVACEMDGRIVVIRDGGKALTVLANQYDGKRFNAPNDLALDQSGGIYFTDPDLRAPKPPPQGKTAVYYIAPDLKVARLIESLPNPKGVCLSPDDKTLYVILSGHPKVFAYSITAPGRVGPRRVFCTLEQSFERRASRGGGGAAVDSKGNLYVATARGVQVFDAKGERLGTIAIPEPASNLTFGGPDFKTLYVTAAHSLYAARMEVAGSQVSSPVARLQGVTGVDGSQK
jgi:gluconolactonase